MSPTDEIVEAFNARPRFATALHVEYCCSGRPDGFLDLRSRLELEKDPSVISGAFHMSPDEVETRHAEIPRDRDIILYCSCPNEVTSARVALLLRRKGIERVRPLLGGIDAWRERDYPMDQRSDSIPSAQRI